MKTDFKKSRLLLCASALLAAWAPAGSAAEGERSANVVFLTLREAVETALANNPSLIVQKREPGAKGLDVVKERAAFDPEITASLSAQESHDVSGRDEGLVDYRFEMSKRFESGTETSLGLQTSADSAAADDYSSQMEMTVSRPLLKEGGAAVNLVRLRQAELAAQTSVYELQDFTEALLAQVEKTYWDFALARKSLEIYEKSLDVARQRLDETNAEIQVGKIAEIERVAAEAETASRRQDLIDAQSEMERLRLRLLRLTGLGKAGNWDREVVTLEDFSVPGQDPGDVEALAAEALRKRPDLNQARLALERNELEVVKTENGLLPDLDLTLSALARGAANGARGSMENLFDGDYEARASIVYALPAGKRSLKASHAQSAIRKAQAEEAIYNLEQIAQEEVRAAWVEIQRNRRQIEATKATRALQEEKYRAEVEKQHVGRSTILQVAQAQRDMTSGQIDEQRATANHQKSLADLYRAEGVLMERWNLALEAPASAAP